MKSYSLVMCIKRELVILTCWVPSTKEHIKEVLR